VREVEPGTIVTVGHDGELGEVRFAEKCAPKPCSFERIYFSRGNDPRIYRERKALGSAMVPQISRSIGGRYDNAVFSFIPNTAEIAYHGMMDGLRIHRREEVGRQIMAAAEEGRLDETTIRDLILHNWPRGEKVAHKDIKMRTFIAQEKGRDQLVSHVYDITYGVVGKDDALVVLDDSIVRGTTLKKSILKILARTNPRKIVICSTAPQIRYPDCYGIDMSELGKFIAFQAAVAMHRRAGRQSLLDRINDDCRRELAKPREERVNRVKAVYEGFEPGQISAEIARMVYPEDIGWHGGVEVIYQTIDNLHASIEGPCGDWYFTGDYPTPGGVTTVNAAYVAWAEGIGGRSYDLGL
jgi:amidophosphoribosyltransferase